MVVLVILVRQFLVVIVFVVRDVHLIARARVRSLSFKVPQHVLLFVEFLEDELTTLICF